MRRQYIRFTPQDVKTIVTLWESKTTQEIAEELGRTVPSIQQIAHKIRKVYPQLKKKNNPGTLQNLIKQTLNL